jgi:hypothetical protein
LKYINLFVFIILYACSTPVLQNKYIPDDIDRFIESWNSDYGPYPESQVNELEAYIRKIHHFYKEHEVEAKFPHYLTSFNNNLQLLAHLENNLPARFKKYYGRWPVRRSPNYLRYEREQTTDLRKKLDGMREMRLRQDLGYTKFELLIKYVNGIDKKGLDFKVSI